MIWWNYLFNNYTLVLYMYSTYMYISNIRQYHAFTNTYERTYYLYFQHGKKLSACAKLFLPEKKLLDMQQKGKARWWPILWTTHKHGEKANIPFGCYPRSVETWRLRVATLCPLRNVGLNKWRVLFVAPTRKNPWETTPLPNPSHIPSHPYPSRNLATSGRRSRCGHLPKPKFSPTEKPMIFWIFGRVFQDSPRGGGHNFGKKHLKIDG